MIINYTTSADVGGDSVTLSVTAVAENGMLSIKEIEYFNDESELPLLFPEEKLTEQLIDQICASGHEYVKHLNECGHDRYF
jgi:hypothetical protein